MSSEFDVEGVIDGILTLARSVDSRVGEVAIRLPSELIDEMETRIIGLYQSVPEFTAKRPDAKLYGITIIRGIRR